MVGIHTSIQKSEKHTYQPYLYLTFAGISTFQGKITNFSANLLSRFTLSKLKGNWLIIWNSLVLMHDTVLRYQPKWPLLLWPNLRGIRGIGTIWKWAVDDVYSTGVFLEKKHRLEICREMHSDAKWLHGRGAIGDWQLKCRLLVVISGMQGTRGVSHRLTW